MYHRKISGACDVITHPAHYQIGAQLLYSCSAETDSMDLIRTMEDLTSPDATAAHGRQLLGPGSGTSNPVSSLFSGLLVLAFYLAAFVAFVVCIVAVIIWLCNMQSRPRKSDEKLPLYTQQQQQQIEVSVPDGFSGGMQLQVQTPAGLLNVQIPKGLGPGQKFHTMVLQPVKAAPASTEKWSDFNLSCTENGLCGCCCDCCTCCAVTWCPFITSAQLYGRLVAPGKCCLMASILVTLTVVASLCTVIHLIVRRRPDEVSVWSFAADFGQFLGFVGMVVLVMKARQTLREKHGHDSQCCGAAEDGCYALWCLPCTSCLLLRMAGLGGGEYELCEV